MADPLKRRSIGGTIFDIGNYLFLGLLAFTVFYPFWQLLIISFSNTQQVVTLGFHLWIPNWNPNAYLYIVERNIIGRAYFNTILKTVVGTAVIVVLTLFAAYPLAKRNLPARNVFTWFFIITLFFSGGIIPLYILVRNLGLINSLWALILPGAVHVYYIIIMRNFLMTVDDSLEESAFMDGANEFVVLFRIIVPIAKPAIAVVVLWSSVQHWNAWFDALLYIQDNNKIVLQLLLRRMLLGLKKNADDLLRGASIERLLEERIPSASIQAAMTIATIGPIILMYPFLQRYFVKGIIVGALKG